jgi:ketosteroid isomerase-like protein
MTGCAPDEEEKSSRVGSALPQPRDSNTEPGDGPAAALDDKRKSSLACHLETWNAGDMDAFGELYDPDAIVRPPQDWPEPGPFVGREAVMRQWEHVREACKADVVEPISDFIDVGDRVAVRHT